MNTYRLQAPSRIPHPGIRRRPRTAPDPLIHPDATRG